MDFGEPKHFIMPKEKLCGEQAVKFDVDLGFKFKSLYECTEL